MRTSGVLMPISSLPSQYGIGTMGKEARRFVDFLEKGGQTYCGFLPHLYDSHSFFVRSLSLHKSSRSIK